MPAAFPFPVSAISQSSDKDTKFRTLRSQFGDGYELSRPDGINDEVDTRNIVLENMDATETATLRTFFRSIKGWDYFTLTFPGEAQKKWKVVDGYKETAVSGEHNTFSFAIKQFF